MSTRDQAILWIGASKSVVGSGGGATSGGGNVLLKVPPHRLDGPEHLVADDTDARLETSTDGHGLMPALDGNLADVFRGDGTQAPLEAAEVIYDPTTSGLAATDAQGAIDELAATTMATALDDLSDVTLTAPVAGDRLRFDGSVWRESSLTWRPLMALDPSTGNYVVVTAGGAAVMVEA